MAQLDTDLWDSGDDPTCVETNRVKVLLLLLLQSVTTEDYDYITWCCAAESNCPSQAPALPPCHAPIAVRIDWPAELLGLRLHLPRHLSSSETHSGHCHCPASPQCLSSVGTHTVICRNTHNDLQFPLQSLSNSQACQLTSTFLPTSSVLATKLKL